MCYEWGMQPSEFRECTLLNIAYYIIGNRNRLKDEYKLKNKQMYDFSIMMATMNGINISNALSTKKGRHIDYPKFNYFFKDENEETNENKNDSDVYEVINNDNKYEFLRKQRLAYEKMGYKFD